MPFIVIESENFIKIKGTVDDVISKTIATRIENSKGKLYELAYEIESSLIPYITFQGSSGTFYINTSSSIDNVLGKIIIILKDDTGKELDRKTVFIELCIENKIPSIQIDTPSGQVIECNVGDAKQITLSGSMIPPLADYLLRFRCIQGIDKVSLIDGSYDTFNINTTSQFDETITFEAYLVDSTGTEVLGQTKPTITFHVKVNKIWDTTVPDMFSLYGLDDWSGVFKINSDRTLYEMQNKHSPRTNFGINEQTYCIAASAQAIWSNKLAPSDCPIFSKRSLKACEGQWTSAFNDTYNVTFDFDNLGYLSDFPTELNVEGFVNEPIEKSIGASIVNDNGNYRLEYEYPNKDYLSGNGDKFIINSNREVSDISGDYIPKIKVKLIKGDLIVDSATVRVNITIKANPAAEPQIVFGADFPTELTATVGEATADTMYYKTIADLPVSIINKESEYDYISCSSSNEDMITTVPWDSGGIGVKTDKAVDADVTLTFTVVSSSTGQEYPETRVSKTIHVSVKDIQMPQIVFGPDFPTELSANINGAGSTKTFKLPVSLINNQEDKYRLVFESSNQSIINDTSFDHTTSSIVMITGSKFEGNIIFDFYIANAMNSSEIPNTRISKTVYVKIISKNEGLPPPDEVDQFAIKSIRNYNNSSFSKEESESYFAGTYKITNEMDSTNKYHIYKNNNNKVKLTCTGDSLRYNTIVEYDYPPMFKSKNDGLQVSNPPQNTSKMTKSFLLANNIFEHCGGQVEVEYAFDPYLKVKNTKYSVSHHVGDSGTGNVHNDNELTVMNRFSLPSGLDGQRVRISMVPYESGNVVSVFGTAEEPGFEVNCSKASPKHTERMKIELINNDGSNDIFDTVYVDIEVEVIGNDPAPNPDPTLNPKIKLNSNTITATCIENTDMIFNLNAEIENNDGSHSLNYIYPEKSYLTHLENGKFKINSPAGSDSFTAKVQLMNNGVVESEEAVTVNVNVSIPTDEIVCLCNAVHESLIRNAINENKLSTYEETQEKTGAGAGSCNGFRCKDKIENILAGCISDRGGGECYTSQS